MSILDKLKETEQERQERLSRPTAKHHFFWVEDRLRSMPEVKRSAEELSKLMGMEIIKGTASNTKESSPVDDAALEAKAKEYVRKHKEDTEREEKDFFDNA